MRPARGILPRSTRDCRAHQLRLADRTRPAQSAASLSPLKPYCSLPPGCRVFCALRSWRAAVASSRRSCLHMTEPGGQVRAARAARCASPRVLASHAPGLLASKAARSRVVESMLPAEWGEWRKTSFDHGDHLAESGACRPTPASSHSLATRRSTRLVLTVACVCRDRCAHSGETSSRCSRRALRRTAST